MIIRSMCLRPSTESVQNIPPHPLHVLSLPNVTKRTQCLGGPRTCDLTMPPIAFPETRSFGMRLIR